jgi:dihydroorotase
MERPMIAEGQDAVLSFFDPAGKTILQTGTTRSKSKNSPFIGKELAGKVIGILNREKLVLNKSGDQ